MAEEEGKVDEEMAVNNSKTLAKEASAKQPLPPHLNQNSIEMNDNDNEVAVADEEQSDASRHQEPSQATSLV